MTDQTEKPRRGRKPKDGKEAIPGVLRQTNYVRARRREAGEVVRALRGALAEKTARAAFLASYPAGTSERALIRRGIDRALTDDPAASVEEIAAAMDFFDRLFRQ